MQRQLIRTSDLIRTEPTGRAAGADQHVGPIPEGVQVELRSRFDDRWTHGFAVAVVGDGQYQLRRLSDGCVLPAWFPAHMLRPIVES